MADSYEAPQTLLDSAGCTIRVDYEIAALLVTWRDYVPSDYFREIHEMLLTFLRAYKVTKIVGDDTLLPIIHQEDQDWLVNNWVPRAAAAGLKAAASKRPEKYFAQTTVSAVQDRLALSIRLRAFDSLPEARDWIVRAN